MIAYRIIVCGGRDYNNRFMVFGVLRKIWYKHEKRLVVIEGGARGADEAARVWAERFARLGVEHLPFPANWDKYGNDAGRKRNHQMLDQGKPDLVVAFPGGRGTRNMVEQARYADVPVMLGADNMKMLEVEELVA